MFNFLIGYDLEGPISPLDHAFEVCQEYVEDGDKVFAVNSRLDDLLALGNREGYEPGDTLKLITPFLIAAGATEDNLRTVSQKAGLVPGIKELFACLLNQDYHLSIISTSYEQHAQNIGKQLGLSLGDIYSTYFKLDDFWARVSKKDICFANSIREKVVKLYVPNLDSGINDQAIKSLLDPFFWEKLPKSTFGPVMEQIKVMGGRRKVAALQTALLLCNLNYLYNALVIGDSITDWRMLQVVEAAGGLAVAWNANQYVLPWATCAVAAIDARATQPLIQEFAKGGRPAVRRWIEAAPLPEEAEKGPYYHWVAGKDKYSLERILNIHKQLRIFCRGAETAQLG